MKHFTYGLDEGNLRAQLKSIAVPMKDENWTRFEAYTDAMAPLKVPTSRFRDLQVKLSRDVIVPVVFGVVIIMFSFLLFNFISIKDHGNQAATKQAVVNLPEKQSAMPDLQAQPAPVETAPVVAPEVPSQAASAQSTEKLSLEPRNEIAVVKPEHIVRKHKQSAEETLITDIRPTLISEDTDPEIRPN